MISNHSTDDNDSATAIDYNDTDNGDANIGYLDYSLEARIVISILLVLIIALTVSGNVVVMLAVSRIRSMRTLSNAFVFSLAVADMLVGLCVMPWSVVVQLSNGYWYLGRPFCLVWMSWDVYFSTISIVHFSCLAVDRYLAICDPFRYTRLVTSHTVVAMLVTCWLLPGFMSFLPILAGWNTRGIEHLVPGPEVPACFLVVNLYFALICSFIAFYIPLAAILFCYWRIFVIARRQARKIRALEIAGGGGGNGTGGVGDRQAAADGRSWSKIQRDMKAAKTLAIIVGAFSLCYLPFFTMNVLDPFLDYQLDPTQGSKLWIGVTWLGYCNSMINPWIYYVSNKNFRAAFRKILCCDSAGPQWDRELGYSYSRGAIARTRLNASLESSPAATEAQRHSTTANVANCGPNHQQQVVVALRHPASSSSAACSSSLTTSSHVALGPVRTNRLNGINSLLNNNHNCSMTSATYV